MKKIFIGGIIAGFSMLLLSISGLYATIYLFPSLAEEYFNPAFESQSSRIMIYYMHPFIISMSLAWFWSRFKHVLTGSYIARGIEFGFIYLLVATFPMMWLIYSALDVSLGMVITWFILRGIKIMWGFTPYQKKMLNLKTIFRCIKPQVKALFNFH